MSYHQNLKLFYNIKNNILILLLIANGILFLNKKPLIGFVQKVTKKHTNTLVTSMQPWVENKSPIKSYWRFVFVYGFGTLNTMQILYCFKQFFVVFFKSFNTLDNLIREVWFGWADRKKCCHLEVSLRHFNSTNQKVKQRVTLKYWN